MKKRSLCYAGCAIPLVIATALFAGDGNLKPIEYTNEGGMPLPGYGNWVFIGSGLSISAQANRDPRFSNIFAEPAAYDQYMKNGVWPDRTVMFAEKRAAVTMASVTACST